MSHSSVDSDKGLFEVDIVCLVVVNLIHIENISPLNIRMI